MAAELSARESAVLRLIAKRSAGSTRGGATGLDLTAGLERAGFSATSKVAHHVAANLVEKGLASRAGTPKLQRYRVTDAGLRVLDGDRLAPWIAKGET